MQALELQLIFIHLFAKATFLIFIYFNEMKLK